MQKNETDNTDTVGETFSKMKITIGSQVFTATLRDNAAIKAFKALLPMTIIMSELNYNEKIFYSLLICRSMLRPGIMRTLISGDLNESCPDWPWIKSGCPPYP